MKILTVGLSFFPANHSAVDGVYDHRDRTVARYVGRMGSGNGSSSGTGSAILNAVKQPVVWCPTLAVVIVLLGIKLPVAVYPSFDLIAHANSGVAVFAAGLALATVKFSVNTEILWNSIFSGSAFKYAELVEVSISVTVMSSDLLSSVLIL